MELQLYFYVSIAFQFSLVWLGIHRYHMYTHFTNPLIILGLIGDLRLPIGIFLFILSICLSIKNRFFQRQREMCVRFSKTSGVLCGTLLCLCKFRSSVLCVGWFTRRFILQIQRLALTNAAQPKGVSPIESN